MNNKLIININETKQEFLLNGEDMVANGLAEAEITFNCIVGGENPYAVLTFFAPAINKTFKQEMPLHEIEINVKDGNSYKNQIIGSI